MVANIRGYTPNYAFKLVNFDTPRWHTLEYANWTQLDGMLLQAGIPGIRGEWTYSTLYLVGDRVYDSTTNILYRCLVEHTSAATGTFEADRIAHPTYWTVQTLGVPVFRGVWQPNATYSLGDIVVVNTYTYYLCITNHTSPPAFTPDATKWTLVFDATAAVNSTNASATAAAGSATQAASSASNAATSATNSANSATEAALQAQKLFGTSTSSNTIGLTAKTFTTQADKYFNVGKFVMIRADLDPINNWMWGQVSSYTGTTLVVNSITSNGAGTFVSWIIDVSGSRGAIGPQGVQGEIGPPLVLKGTVTTASALPPTGNTIGDAYIAEDNQHLYVWDGTMWDDAGPLGTSTTTTADTPPSNPKDGDMWFETDTGIFWVYYTDVNSSQWVQAGGTAASINQNFVLKTGDTMTGALTISKADPVIALNKPASGTSSGLQGFTNGVLRWNVVAGDYIPETGSNAGSNFAITGFSDAGALLNEPALTITRATGVTTLKPGALVLSRWSQTTQEAYISGYVGTTSRWRLVLGSAAAETGSNAGSDFAIVSQNDAGAHLAVPLSINRATGATTLTGDLTISKAGAALVLEKAASGQSSSIYARTGASNRWAMDLGTNAAETGADAGSNFALSAFADAGGYLSTPLQVNRKTGVVALSSATPSTSPTTGALTVAGGLGVGGNIVQAASAYHNLGGISPNSNPGIGNVTNGIEMIGTSAAGYIAISNNVGTNVGLFLNSNQDGQLASFRRAGTQVGSITIAGSATAYNTSSDASLKEDLKSFDAGSIIDNTEVYDFAWKSTKERAFGIVAQQAVEVYPQAITHTEASTEKGLERDEWWGVDYSKYVPVLLQELKALRARVAELEGHIVEKPSTTPRGRK